MKNIVVVIFPFDSKEEQKAVSNTLGDFPFKIFYCRDKFTEKQ